MNDLLTNYLCSNVARYPVEHDSSCVVLQQLLANYPLGMELSEACRCMHALV